MSRLFNIAVALAFTLPLAAHANDGAHRNSAQASQNAASGADVDAQGSPVDFATSEVKTSARIVELDKTNRSAVLRTAQGAFITVHVPRSVRNFDQVQVGDQLVARYKVASVVNIEPASKLGIRELVESSSTQTAKPGSLPGVETDRQLEILATIEAINHKTNIVKLRGATRTFNVPIPRNIDTGSLQVGDEVHAVIRDAIVIDVEKG